MTTAPFRLATLLKLREQTRDERRRRLAQAVEAAHLVGRQQAALDDELGALRAVASAPQAGAAVDVDRLLHAHRYRLQLELRRQVLAGQLTEIAAEIERRRAALVEADRQVRTLEKLRERQALRRREEQERRTNRELDELALVRQSLREEPS